MVIYRGADGKPGYHQTDDIHDAVGFVEQMRNEDGVEHARIFRLEEVVFQYRPYYRVELTESAAGLNGAPRSAEISDGGVESLEAGNAGSSPKAASPSNSTGPPTSGPPSTVGSPPNGGATVSDVIDADATAAGTGDKKGLFGR